MKITIKATGLDITPSLHTFIEDKLGGLQKFIRRFDEEGLPKLHLEIARTTRHHRHGEVFMAEANLRLPKKIIRATRDDIDVRAAIDKLKMKLRLEIDKYKTRHDPKEAVKRATKKRV
ncbi:MAG: ribosome-associated translation inhibitor RaiA [Patescibacteria group bacterium]|mgnify:CR=1 FL=1